MSELKKCPIDIVKVRKLCRDGELRAYIDGECICLMDVASGECVKIGAADNRRAQPDNETRGLTAWETPESCPNCNEHLSKDWSYCPECGRVTDWVDNAPLTLEELRGMDLREWCWIEVLVPFDFAPKVSAYYQRQEVGTESGAMRGTFWCGYPGLTFGFDYSDYGKTWLAYRRKPEPEGGEG